MIKLIVWLVELHLHCTEHPYPYLPHIRSGLTLPYSCLKGVGKAVVNFTVCHALKTLPHFRPKVSFVVSCVNHNDGTRYKFLHGKSFNPKPHQFPLTQNTSWAPGTTNTNVIIFKTDPQNPARH